MFTIKELAERARISEKTAYAWVRSGTVPATRIGGVWRVKASDLDAMGL